MTLAYSGCYLGILSVVVLAKQQPHLGIVLAVVLVEQHCRFLLLARRQLYRPYADHPAELLQCPKPTCRAAAEIVQFVQSTLNPAELTPCQNPVGGWFYLHSAEHIA